jgi:hypothetical protein
MAGTPDAPAGSIGATGFSTAIRAMRPASSRLIGGCSSLWKRRT